MNPDFRKRRSIAATALLAVLFIAGVLYRMGPHAGIFPHCLLFDWTGWYCPGCGMTRAVFAAMHGRFAEAFRMNPLGMVLLPIVSIGLAIEGYGWLRGRPLPWRFKLSARSWWLLILIVALYGILRNLPGWPWVLLAPHESTTGSCPQGGEGLWAVMPLLLGVNIDHVATLRQARYAADPEAANAEPCPVDAGLDAVAGGADSITIHVRGDRRHMQDADAIRIRRDVPVPLNLEMGVTEEMLGLALTLMPDYVCLVPENRMEITTEGGLDVLSQFDRVRSMVSRLQDAGIKTSLFINPDREQVDAAARAGAKMIELHTGCFANAIGSALDAELSRLTDAARCGHDAGLQVNAGHGINYHNIERMLEVPHLAELNIGHSIVCRSIKVGMRVAVAEMKARMSPYGC